MEHTFFIYYKEQTFSLESLVKEFGLLGMPMNRARIGVGVQNEISSFGFDPFNKEYLGLHLTFVFTNADKIYNKLLPENINGLLEYFEYEQVCYLSYHDINLWQITKAQIEQVDLIFNSIAKANELLIYSNGHQYYNLNTKDLKTNQQKILDNINEKWN